jgi:hypothetical protein
MIVKAVKLTGLIPVKLTRDSLPYKGGDIHGFFPAVVEKLLAADPPDAELVDIPDDVETVNIVISLPSEAVAETVEELEPVVDVAIPDNWETMNVLKLIKLAKKLDASIDTEIAARAAISAELDRRTAPQT